MKRILAASIAFGVVFLGGMAVRAATSRTPEVDRANATTQLVGQFNRGTSCVGEDGVTYVTFKGSLTGGESQVLPDPTDYSVTGPLAISAIVWTINVNTLRGVLTGKITLSTSTGSSAYVGKVTLVTQGFPTPGALVPARGWIVASFTPPDETVTPGDDTLLANAEFYIGTLAGVPEPGQFGDAAPSGGLGFPDYAVITNVAPKALDGTC